MMSNSRRARASDRLNLRVGELVEVKSEAEILATLDGEGKLECLPFMPEMLKYCGQRFHVYKRAEKTCDTIGGTWRRRMFDTVHLDLRCDGEAHDGCQSRCLLFWKESWLRRAGSPGAVGHSATPSRGPAPVCRRETLTAMCRCRDAAGEPVYMCQSTELKKATAPLAWWHADQYVRDLRSGNVTIAGVIRGAFIGGFNMLQTLLSRCLPAPLLLRAGLKYPFIEGKLKTTPKATLNLATGDLVEIKSKTEITATLDRHNRNRGLLFDREMVRYCGSRARVLSRATRIVDERTGKMIELHSDCLMLEGVFCRGEFNQFCPRGIYSMWREIWLKKVD